jgi:hypothetical protein
MSFNESNTVEQMSLGSAGSTGSTGSFVLQDDLHFSYYKINWLQMKHGRRCYEDYL